MRRTEMINNRQEIDMSDDEVTEALAPTVAEYTGPVLLGAILALLGLGIALIWGLDWRWFWSAAVIAVGVVITTAWLDNGRKEQAEAEAAVRAAEEWAVSPWNVFRNGVSHNPKETVHPVKDQP